MTKINRRPSRAAVLRSLAELEILWRPPDENETAPAGTRAANRESRQTRESYARDPRRARGRR